MIGSGADELRQYDVSVREDGSLTISGIDQSLLVSDEGWYAQALGNRRFLVRNEQDRPAVEHSKIPGYAWVSAHQLYALLKGIHESLWTGMLSVETSVGSKSIYFLHGDLVFAGSGLFDDRLGEVIYREGDLSLDELTDSAAQVTRNRKFGQVLISSGLFDHVRLWDALKAQVYQIVCSIFMDEHVGVEFFSHEEPTSEVRFSYGTAELLERCFAFGNMYLGFVSRMEDSTEISLSNQEQADLQYPPGTFLGDLIQLLHSVNTVKGLLEVSKLKKQYTLMGLMFLMNEGLCHLQELKPVRMPEGRSYLLSLKSKMNIYELLLEEAHVLFEEAGEQFPAAEMQLMARTLNEDRYPVLFLNSEGQLHPESIHHVFFQCLAVRKRVIYFEAGVDSLIRFLIQVVRDRLGSEHSEKVINSYRKFAYR
ncbi:MAG: DUF4388 domain-containing protein [Deltaproteobacteria bacterium]|nr:DUF4388 domain-containing protein [Deltaproteobacteria bacterium]